MSCPMKIFQHENFITKFNYTNISRFTVCNYMYNSHLEQMTAQNCTLRPWESCKCTKHVHVNELEAVRAFKL